MNIWLDDILSFQCPWGTSVYIWKAKSYPIVTKIAAAMGYFNFKYLVTINNYKFYIEHYWKCYYEVC